MISLKKSLIALAQVSIVCLFALTAEAQIRAATRISGLSQPVDIVNAGDGSGRLFIVEQGGTIRIFRNKTLLSQPFLNISDLISCCGERGLLSAVFHPNYERNGLFYVHYTNIFGDIVIARFRVSNDPNVANRSTRKPLLAIQHRQFGNHNGGKLQFGRDGYLYISTGDGGGGGDPNNNAQNLRSLLGKILRIDVNQGNPYAIPPDNPFVNDPNARKEIWAYGLRNPWRIGVDRKNGALYIGDVGQGEFEEINFQGGKSPGGENYGWRLMEGRHCFNPQSGCNNGTLKLPIIEYSHSQGCAVTGGLVYRGKKIPALLGTYLYSDFCSGVISGAKRVNGVWTNTVLLRTGKNISTFGEDETGELYFAHHGGQIFQIRRKLQ